MNCPAEWVSPAHRDHGRPGEGRRVDSQINSNTVSHTCCACATPSASPSPSLQHIHTPDLSPLSCGCVLAMIHLTRQHFIRAFRENRGFCHFPESLALPGAGSTPLASPSRLPSTTLPPSWREREMGDREISGRYCKLIWTLNNLGCNLWMKEAIKHVSAKEHYSMICRYFIKGFKHL